MRNGSMPRRRLAILADQRGAAAVEFAIVFPFLCLLTFGTIALGIGIWTGNLLEDVSAEAARCIAIESPVCGSVSNGCSDTAGTCFVLRLASDRGLFNMASDQITIDRAAQIEGVIYTTVAIVYPFSLLGYEMTLTAKNRFPNQG